MNLKKTAAAAAVICTSAMLTAVSVSAEEVGKAGIYLADNDWAVQYWGGEADGEGNSGIKKVENAVIDGDGDYYSYIELDSTAAGLSFAALCTDIETGKCPDGMTVEITSVEVNGSNVRFAVNGTPRWKDDGGYMRINIYNAWSKDAEDVAVEKSDLDNVSSIKVSFTVDGLEEDAPETTTAAETTTAEITTTTEETTEAVPEETEPPAEETEAPETEAETEAPDTDEELSETAVNTEDSASTGNSTGLVMTALTVAIGAAMVISRNKKS